MKSSNHLPAKFRDVIGGKKKSIAGIFIAVIVLGSVMSSSAWLRSHFSDDEVVSRAAMIVVGHIREGSVAYVPHNKAGSSWEYHVELCISEILKGECVSNSMVVSIHYGLTPIVGRFGCRKNSLKDAVEIWDTGNSQMHFAPVCPDIRSNQIWLLWKNPKAENEDTDWIGIYDPEDIQPLSRREELLQHLK